MPNDDSMLREYVTPDEFLRQFPNLFKPRELAWLIKSRHNNGLADVIKKPTSKKILIHLPGILLWLNEK